MTWVFAFFLLFTLPAHAQNLNLDLNGDLVQGGLIKGKTAPGSTLTIEGKKIRVSKAGDFLFGLGRNHNRTLEIKVNRTPHTFTVAKRTWDIQHVDGLPSKKVTPNPADLKRIKTDNALIGRARRAEKVHTFPTQDFIWPAQGRISGVFGSQRILNGTPKSPHKGLDIAAPAGTPIIAPMDGMVSLTQDDMFYTGKTIILDHGYGLTSVYIHMNSINVEEGDTVKQGDQIGTVGMTGRATGPHLHWGVNWFNVALDPQLLVPKQSGEK